MIISRVVLLKMVREHENNWKKKGDVETTSSSSQEKVPSPQNSDSEDVDQQNNSILASLVSILCIISPALVVFAAARNTITWHCQRFWGASADFWQASWDQILDTMGEDPYMLWVYGTLAVNIAVYWMVGALYTIWDVTNKPGAIMRYKIQPGMNEPVNTKRLLKVIGWVLFNQIVVTFLMSVMSYRAMQWRGYPSIRELPTFHWVLFEIAVLILVEEIGFYYSHRALHSKFVYKYIHKKHHEWTAPIAVTAIYAHPIEHIFSNLVPVFAGLFIMGSHIATAYLWYSLAILATLHSHSGYHLPFLPSPEFHDYHHLKFTQNFGVLGVLDRLHGTDAKFRNTIEFTRHLPMLTLVPAREMFPDRPKQQLGK